MTTSVLGVLFGLVGLVVGVALTLCADFLPPASPGGVSARCPACGERRPLHQLLPLIGYLWARGRCGRCRAPMSLRPLLVELAAAVLFGCLAWRLGLGAPLGVYLFYTSVLVIVFVIDVERQLILNTVSCPAIVAAFGLSWLLPELGPLHSAVGGAFGGITLVLPFVVYRGKGLFGLGDVILGVLVGLMVGWPVIVFVLLLSAVGAAAVAVFLLCFRGKKGTDVIPFGPFLAVAAVLSFFWGGVVSRWWLSCVPW